jgi:hypothetical protein
MPSIHESDDEAELQIPTPGVVIKRQLIICTRFKVVDEFVIKI